MTNPTSNFGWQMPTASDLVTDLPADFETFGQAVDTSLADLKGGTSGQVLSKASNTDMDFTWVAQDDSNAIQNAIVDAKGDLIAASAADTPARLAVGANGETLVADSSTSTGLRYTGGTVQANPVINSAFQVWQRGTSFAFGAVGGAYTADRWSFLNPGSGNFTISRQATGDSTNLPNIQYCLRLQRNSGQTATTVQYLTQSMESVNSIPFAGKTITVSFYARRGANYSATSNLFGINVESGTGTDQNINSSFTGATVVVSQTVALTTTWQRFSFTGTVAATATQLGYYFYYTPTGTAGAADFYEVTGVQIDIGSVALPFRTNAGTIQGELQACQRYLPSIQVSSSDIAIGQAYATTASLISIPFPVTARIAPTGVIVNAAGNFRLRNATSSLLTCTSLLFSTASTQSASLDGNVASGLVAGNATNLYNAGSGTILFTGCEL